MQRKDADGPTGQFQIKNQAFGSCRDRTFCAAHTIARCRFCTAESWGTARFALMVCESVCAVNEAVARWRSEAKCCWTAISLQAPLDEGRWSPSDRFESTGQI